MSATKKPTKKEPIQEITEEIEEIIETVIEEPKKTQPMVTKRFENKIDLSPITDKLELISDKLETVLKPKETKVEPILTPDTPPKVETRGYKWFDEFDPSL